MKHFICVAFGTATFISAMNAEAATAGNFTQQQICRATIGAIMGRDPKIIKVDKTEAGVVHVKYIRPNDASVWENRCRIEGARVVWATGSGRWREHPQDEVITYGATPAAVTITQKFGDGSSSVKSYTRAALKPH